MESTDDALAILAVELLEAGHFYGLLFAQRCYLLSLQQVQYRPFVVVVRDWEGKVLQGVSQKEAGK